MNLITSALVMAASGAAWAANESVASLDVSKLSPQQQAHWAKAKTSRPAATPLYNYDIAAPTLSAVKVSSRVNASLTLAEANVTLTLRDNLSGLYTVSVTLEGPGGQQAFNDWVSSYPEKGRQTLSLAVPMSDVSQNGTWKVTSVQLADANYNSSFYDETQLAAMGTKTFEVVNAQGDIDAPSLQAGGGNLTPVVSRSKPPAGMLPGAYPRVGVRLQAVDTGSSGVRRAALTFCKQATYDCIYVNGYVPVRGQTSGSLTLGGSAYPFFPLGTYVVHSGSVEDFSGNVLYYYSGDPALANLLDVSTIELTE
ncbi:MAG: hypothetical protein U5L74_03385 [Ideonella sp.]|nr:hypothetical protein [Ideonella sp.]